MWIYVRWKRAKLRTSTLEYVTTYHPYRRPTRQLKRSSPCAFPLICLSSEQAVSELLAEANAAVAAGEDEKAKAEAQIKVEVLTAMQAAVA